MSLAIISLISGILADSIEKPELVCKGLFRLALIEDDKVDKIKSDSLTFDDLEYVIQNGLKNKLMKIRIENIDEIITHLINELVKKQAIFTMKT